ncbi:MAG: hypothetical protein IJC57_03295 [Clostridia bacterium]|nr:hypothetical protein [Clostridia bacterium]
MGSNTEQIQELQALIEQKSTELRETNNKLEQEKQKLSQAKNILLKYRVGKLFTRRELKELEQNRLEQEKLKFEQEKLNIKTITKNKFEEARKIRLEAQDKILIERAILEKQAQTIEKKAIEHEIYVMNCILHDKQESYENVLVNKICSELNLRNNQKKLYSENFSDSCKKLKKEIRDIKLKIFESNLRLNNYY